MFGNCPSNDSQQCSHISKARCRRRRAWSLQAAASGGSDDDQDEETAQAEPPQNKKKQRQQREEQTVDDLEEMLDQLAALGGVRSAGLQDMDMDLGMDIGDEDVGEDYFVDDWDSLEEFFESLPPGEDEDIDDDDDEADDTSTYMDLQSASLLENALLQGVVPANAGVGSNILPGDYNFDPLNLASKDYFPMAQAYVKMIIPAGSYEDDNEDDKPIEGKQKTRPQALILRDYREAEIRHGRLAMLAAAFWPLQELADRLFLDKNDFDSLVHSLFFGGVTLPYFPLLMTAIMLLLGYLDVYSQAIKDMDKIGEAFLPGDCFWDPLQILTGAPDQMKRNMQERELFNGRFAMLAIAIFILEEVSTGQPLVSIEGNELLFEPAYQVPFIQEWLDGRYSTPSPIFYNDEDTPGTELLVSTIGDSLHQILN